MFGFGMVGVSRRPTNATMRRLVGLCGVVLVALIFTACGEAALPGPVVAQVGGDSITKETLGHWTSVEAILSLPQLNRRQPIPRGLVPDPPSYVSCIAYLQGPGSSTDSGTPPATRAQLKNQCRRRYELLQHHMLDILITDLWLKGEAAAKGLKVSNYELRTALRHQFPDEGAFRQFLVVTGETRSDDMLVLTRDLLVKKFQRAVITRNDRTLAEQQSAFVRFSEELEKKWSGRTRCRPEHVVSECGH
jgi:hypothetical protein